MWHWLRKNHFKVFLVQLSKRQIFLVQLGFFVFLCHLLFGFIFSLLYHGYHDQERFVLSTQKQTSILVLCPLEKKIKQKTQSKKIDDNEVKGTKVIDYQTYQKEKDRQKAMQPQTITKEDIQTQSVKSEVKRVMQKTITQKSVIKSKLKMVDVEVVETKANQEEPKKRMKTLKRKEILPKEPKIQEKKHEDKLCTDLNLDNVEFIGYEQLDSLTIQHKIQGIIQQYFKPPIGMSKDISCEFSVTISSQGLACKVKIVRSSGIIAYDTSARTALYKARFPKEVWNKTITIVLGQ